MKNNHVNGGTKIMKKFTNDEKAIARNIDKNYKWIARDRDGNLCAYEERPKKEGDNWFSDGYEYIYYFNHLFSAIQWEDEEPTRISDIYNPQVLDNAEREYLKMVLKPFHDRVKYVEKVHDYPTDSMEYLFIQLHDGKLEFPDFDSGEMYCGMELNKRYTLDELGITYEEEKS